MPILFTLLLIRDGMDRDDWGCGVVREELHRVRCLVLPVCVCLWNNTAAYEQSSIAKEKHQRRSPRCGVSHFLDVTVKVGIVCCYQSCECATGVNICSEQTFT